MRKHNALLDVFKKPNVLLEMIVGILGYGIIAQIIILFAPHRVFHSIGLWIGIGSACAMAAHMKHSIETALDIGETGATAHMYKTFAVRWVVLSVILFATVYFRIGSLITLFIGVMGLKIGAYLQPHICKYFSQKRQNDEM